MTNHKKVTKQTYMLETFKPQLMKKISLNISKHSVQLERIQMENTQLLSIQLLEPVKRKDMSTLKMLKMLKKP